MRRYDLTGEGSVRALEDAAAMMQASIDEDRDALVTLMAGADAEDIELLFSAAISLAVQMAEATTDPAFVIRSAVDAVIQHDHLTVTTS